MLKDIHIQRTDSIVPFVQDFENALKHYAKNVQSSPDLSTFEKAIAARDQMKNEVESLQSRYQTLQLHADETRGRLSRAMEESDVSRPEIEDETTRWNSSVQRLLDWVESQEESLANQSAPSLNRTELKEQLEKHRVSGELSSSERCECVDEL